MIPNKKHKGNNYKLQILQRIPQSLKARVLEAAAAPVSHRKKINK